LAGVVSRLYRPLLLTFAIALWAILVARRNVVVSALLVTLGLALLQRVLAA